MEKKALYAGMLTGLEQVNMSASARKHAEGQMRRAALIMQMLIGKSDGSGAKTTEGAHA